MQHPTESWIREAPPAVESKAVIQQLDRMLKSRHFCNSRRYPAFLAHIVRRTLDGDLDSLKERILGIEVFKRSHDYDTGADPVVRITAGEVRKRIALYYHDEGTEQEMRIELPPGSYIPVFSVHANGAAAQESAAGSWLTPAEPPRPEPATEESRDEARAYRIARTWLFAGIAILLVLIGAAGFWFWTWFSSPVESMWRPFFNSPDPVLIVMGIPPADAALPLDSHSHEHLSFDDALAMTNITGLLDVHNQGWHAQISSSTSLDDLRKRPVVLISAFLNPWSTRILNPLRFSLLRDQIAPNGSTILGSIIDHKRPGTLWSFDFSKPVTVNTKDYAIVARLRSDLTEGPVMIIAGLGAGATESAGEFVSSPEYLKQVGRAAPANWAGKNLELVLEVPMVDGKSGHAHIVAADFW
jgi:hypothetical protein